MRSGNPLWAVIPSIDRHDDLQRLIKTLITSDVNVVVIDTGYKTPLEIEHVDVIRDTDPVRNISRWWNIGLEHVAANVGLTEYTVAVLNDDVVLPAGSVQRLAAAINDTATAAACPLPGLRTPYLVVHGLETHHRMTGFVFALRGSLNLRADEHLQWWYGDNDLDWRARQHGGVAFVGGAWEGFDHLYPNSTTTGELAAQAGRDRETFIKKWGRAPW
jgi:hypothetical protein